MGRLQRIELFNFKSYRGHHVVGPFSSLSAIIGPNGAGKSNLMDAISFVLGVNAVHLRSTTLADLIHRGRVLGGHQLSDNDDAADDDLATQNPQSNPRSAYVLAVYIDNDGNELHFMRTITKQGGSDFRVNDKIVKKEQYTAMLEKQNILVKARNFLVFQGDVEAVASQSAKDLTKLIEQISGSLDYKKDYDELKVTQETATEFLAENYNRKRNLNAELKQLATHQSDAARFESLQQELEQAQIEHTLWKLFHIERDVKTLEKSKTETRLELSEFESVKAEAEGRLNRFRQEQAVVTKKILKAERIVKKKEKDFADLTPDILKTNQQLLHSTKKLSMAQSQLEKNQKEASRLSKGIDDIRAELQQVEVAHQQHEKEVRSQQRRKGAILSEADMTDYNQCKQQVSQKAAKIQSELNSELRSLKTDEEQLQRMIVKDKEQEDRHERLENEDKRLALERKEKLGQAVQELSAGLARERSVLDQADGKRRTLQEQEISLNEKLLDLSNKLLEARIDQRDSERKKSYSEMVELLKQSFDGVHGPLFEKVKPTQRKYDQAISIVLGKNTDAIIVDSQKIAKECIQFLREQRRGFATFLPLDAIVSKSVNPKLRSLHQHARLAVDVLVFEDRFKTAVHYACGDAVVCESLDVAKYICYEKGHQIKTVTIDGTIIHKSGLITGGTSGSASRTSRWEEREVENLKHAHEKIMIDLTEIVKEKRKLADDEGVRSNIMALQNQLDYAKQDYDAIAGRCKTFDKELEHIVQETQVLRPKRDQLQQKVTTVSKHVEELKSEVAQIEDKVFCDFCRRLKITNIREYEQQQLVQVQENNEKMIQFTAQISKLRNTLSFEETRVQEVQARVQSLQDQVTLERQVHDETERRKTELEENVSALREELQQYQETTIKIAKQELEQKIEAVSKARKQLKGVERDIDDIRKKISQAEESIDKLLSDRLSVLRKASLEDLSLPLLEGRLDDVTYAESQPSVSTEHPDSMEIDPSAGSVSTGSERGVSRPRPNIVADFNSLDADLKNNGGQEVEAQFTSRMEKLDDEIERMAPNLRVLDSMSGVKGRYRESEEEFDVARRRARSAKERFNTAKQERHRRFTAAFNHISESIDNVYKELTKSNNFPMGGTAYLSLENEEEPYLEGIKYHAMPPMKRFRDMEQLSGGEKTIAALALLFAIHSYQPSPFFVLDEVDAALDNANVNKIARYVREHASDQFQFIVISLKNTLFEKARGLVGVYRDQEVNSSKILTLDVRH